MGIETEYTVLGNDKTFILYTLKKNEFMKFIKTIADKMLVYQTSKPLPVIKGLIVFQ